MALLRPDTCVLIPTYNNERTLARVIDGVLERTPNVLIVNDGSTDATTEILSRYPQVLRIDHTHNQGKGMALRNGLKAAREAGFRYAITIDSDGQHYPADLAVFEKALEEQGEALYIGSRNMTQDGVPKKSSFGNKFSNFWFWFETGIKLEDTQSGYRLYPLERIPKKYFTKKFEFEIEIIVRSAWSGVPVVNVPVQVKYDPAERVSHFRPFRDFSRISILNTVLVTFTMLYIWPRNLFWRVKKKGLKRYFLENVLHSEDSNRKKALSMALGIFIGISPFWGFQTALAFLLPHAFRLNKAVTFLFSNISIPPMIPLIIYASLQTGNLFFPGGDTMDFYTSAPDFEDIQAHIAQYLVGSFTLATICALFTGLGGYLLLTAWSRRVQAA